MSKKLKLKLMDRYNSIYKYKTSYIKEIYDIIIMVPKKDNFKRHLANVRRLLQVEFGGVFDIVIWYEEEREIHTNIPLNIYLGEYEVMKDDFSFDEYERIKTFFLYRFTEETTLQPLW